MTFTTNRFLFSWKARSAQFLSIQKVAFFQRLLTKVQVMITCMCGQPNKRSGDRIGCENASKTFQFTKSLSRTLANFKRLLHFPLEQISPSHLSIKPQKQESKIKFHIFHIILSNLLNMNGIIWQGVVSEGRIYCAKTYI